MSELDRLDWLSEEQINANTDLLDLTARKWDMEQLLKSIPIHNILGPYGINKLVVEKDLLDMRIKQIILEKEFELN